MSNKGLRLALAVAAGAALFIAACIGLLAKGYYIDEDTRPLNGDPTGYYVAAAMHVEALSRIGTPPRQACLRKNSWFWGDTPCIVIRESMPLTYRCTPHDADQGCYAIEINETVFKQPKIQDLFFNEMRETCWFARQPSPNREEAHLSLDCAKPDGEGWRRSLTLQPILCITVMGADEVPIDHLAIQHGRRLQSRWCNSVFASLQQRNRLIPRECWLREVECDLEHPPTPRNTLIISASHVCVRFPGYPYVVDQSWSNQHLMVKFLRRDHPIAQMQVGYGLLVPAGYQQQVAAHARDQRLARVIDVGDKQFFGVDTGRQPIGFLLQSLDGDETELRQLLTFVSFCDALDTSPEGLRLRPPS